MTDRELQKEIDKTAETTDSNDEYTEEVERMAAERVEIEEKLNARKEELAKIGEFAEAHCIEFKKKCGWAGDNEHIEFIFQFPDGSTSHTEKTSFGLNKDPDSLESFMDDHGAESVTDMIGATHACQYTDSGWRLCDNRTVRDWVHFQHVSEDGSLFQIHWPAVVIYFVLMFGILSVFIGFHSSNGVLAVLSEVAWLLTLLGGGAGAFAFCEALIFRERFWY